MIDLGILMDCAVNFDQHIKQPISKAVRMLSFVKRSGKQLDDPFVTKSLYCHLVRQFLENGSLNWNPYTMTHTKRIETIQRRFVRFTLQGHGWADPFALPPYKQRLFLLDLITLNNRREVANLEFVLKLFDGLIAVPELLGLVSLNQNSFLIRHWISNNTNSLNEKMVQTNQWCLWWRLYPIMWHWQRVNGYGYKKDGIP